MEDRYGNVPKEKYKCLSVKLLIPSDILQVSEMKNHTVAMTRLPGDTATPKHESSASLGSCRDKMHIF